MQRMIVFLTVCALAVAVWPAGTQASDETDQPGPYDAGPNDHTWDCGLQTAPINDCGPEPDTWIEGTEVGFTASNTYSPSPLPRVPFTGTLTLLVSSDNGEVEFTCSFVLDTLQGCQVASIQWPSIGSSFTLECYSGPGSVGHWDGCYINH